MDAINARIGKYQPLSEIESGFLILFQSQEKSIYQEIELTTPELTASFRGLSKLFLSENVQYLPESAFFTDNQSVALNFHPRFMPSAPHQHDFIEVQYIMSGQLRQTINGHPVSLFPGDVCLISPQAIHDPQIFDKESLMVNLLLRLDTFHHVFSSLLAEDDIISNFFMRVLYGQGNAPFLICRTRDDLKLKSLVLDMLDVQECPDLYTDRLLRTMLEQFFIFLLRDHKSDFSTSSLRKKSEENILSILRYIQIHYASVTLTELSQRFKYDEAYLSRLIHAYTGIPFSKMLINARLQHAAVLLKKGERPIAEIMREVGYRDKTHFYRAFRKKFGTTPAQFRNTDS